MRDFFWSKTQSSHQWFHHVIIKAIGINVMSYDVLMNGVFLYSIGFTLGFWNKTTFYKLDGNQEMVRVYTFQYISLGISL
jgi:hypothetical protein